MGEKTYRAWRPDQAWLLPPSPRDWLPEGHLVYFLMDAVRELDISSITSKASGKKQLTHRNALSDPDASERPGHFG